MLNSVTLIAGQPIKNDRVLLFEGAQTCCRHASKRIYPSFGSPDLSPVACCPAEVERIGNLLFLIGYSVIDKVPWVIIEW
jgi:hypothetical protein